jgi:hypothetical protein
MKPHVAAKTIARIEQGKAQPARIQKKTRAAIAGRLGEDVAEIETF